MVYRQFVLLYIIRGAAVRKVPVSRHGGQSHVFVRSCLQKLTTVTTHRHTGKQTDRQNRAH